MPAQEKNITMSNGSRKLSRRTVIGAAMATPAAAAAFAALKLTEDHASADTLSILDVVPQSFHSNILSRVVDNSPSNARALAGHIQRAIDIAASKRCRLIVPEGLYNVAPTGSFEAEAGLCHRCFAIRSDMHVDARAGATFRIIDGVSTDKAVVFMCMFGTNEQLANLSWRGLEMDMNGRSNPISPSRASGNYSLLNQAHIFISGTPAGHAALANIVTIDHCRFLNTPGVSCVVLAQSNSRGVKLGRNWRISDCAFVNGGLDTPDHSAIFAWAQDVVCQRCTFTNTIAKTQTGGNVAFEVHGSRQRFINNNVTNYYQGVWIDGNETEIVSNDIIVSNNVLNKISGFGIMFYGVHAQVSKVEIVGNDISFDDSVYPGVDLKIGIGCLSPLSQRDVVVKSNSVTSKIARTATSGVTIQSATQKGHSHDAFEIANNVFENTTFGVQVITNPVCGLGMIAIRSNRCRNLSRGGAFSTPQGIGVDFNGGASPIQKLSLLNNICTDDRGRSAECAFGIRVQGEIVSLQTAGNSASGMTAAAYAEGALTVARRVQAAL